MCKGDPAPINALFCFWNLIVIGIWIGLGSMLVKNGKQLDELDISPDDLGYINQLANDWTTLPFTEIVITDDTFCPDDYTLVYERIWYGMRIACDCKGVKKIKCGDENSQVRCGKYNADM